jgi:hypothetical protein
MFMLENLPEDDQARRSWQKACEILLAAADGLADVSAVTRQVELALFQQAKALARDFEEYLRLRQESRKSCAAGPNGPRSQWSRRWRTRQDRLLEHQ